MIILLFKGIGLGLVLAMMIGPVLFALIRTSINRGIYAGVSLALGIATSEIIIVVFVNIFISSIQENLIFQTILGYIGGVILVFFGIFTFSQSKVKNNTFKNHKVRPNKKNIAYIFEGVVFNIMNPFVYMFWIIILASIPSEFGITRVQDKFIFLSCIILTVFCTDLLKVCIANFLKRFLTPKVIFIIDKIVGFIFIIFGLRLIFFATLGMGLENNF